MNEFNLLYTHAPHIGYGRMATEIHEALKNTPYVTVYDSIPIPERTPHPIVGEKQGVCEALVYATLPPFITGWWGNQRAHLITMWETDTVPPGFRGDLSGYESIIVPSAFCEELFAPFHSNVVRIPLGVNPVTWAPKGLREPKDSFEFLACGWGPRKGIDLVHRAFLDAFPDGSWGSGPMPRLTLKAHRHNEVPDHERILNFGGRFSDEEEVGFYSMAHCMVAPSRGEGFGLQPLQAMAQGCPTILTDAHGHQEFARHGLPIPAKPAPVPPNTIYRFGRGVGNWFEPDYDHLVDAMRWVYDNYAFEEVNARNQSATVRKEMTWDKTALALSNHVGMSTLIDFDKGDWQTRGQDLVSVTPDRSLQATIGGHKYRFVSGKPTDVPLGVYEVLSKAGYIDA